MSTAAKLGADLAEKRQALASLFESIKTEDGYDRSKNPDIVAEIQKRNAELDTLGKSYKEAAELEAVAEKNSRELEYLNAPANRLPFAGKKVKGGDSEPEFESFGDLVIKSLSGKDGSIRIRHAAKADVNPMEFKTTMTRAAGFAPESLRSGRVQLSAQRPIAVVDVVPMITTSQAAYKYMEETTFTNNAAGLAENDGTGAAESALAFTERSVTIERIATYLPVTKEQVDDVMGLRSLIDSRLSYMIQAKLDYDLLQGNGSTPNINGFYAQVTQAQALGTDPVFDAIFKGITKCRHTGSANPNAIIFHPNDWQDVRLTRTVDGIYILGNPADNAPERLFGLNVVSTTAATENTALVGDFLGHSAFVYRQGIEVEATDSHDTNFRKFIWAIRVSLRGALVVFRASAFCEVTGI
jgi:HK97 family phage major capsid protein